MKNLFEISLVGVLLILTVSQSVCKEAPPNIILITCDQMRGDAFGAAGNEMVNTPNLDYLAEHGVVCKQNFSNNPVCLPSRVSIFSGLYPHQLEIMNNRPANGGMINFENSLPWYLKKAGYALAYIGKNHTFYQSEFEYFDNHELRGRDDFRAYSKYVPPYWHSDIFWPEEDCNPIKNTNDAIAFIENSNQNQPFFLSINYFDPHPPYMAPSEFTSQYCSEDLTIPEYIDPEKLSDRLADQQKALGYDKISKTDLLETIRYYYAAIQWGVDKQIGLLLEALRQKAIEENTIIVFTSDHGDFMGEYHMVRKGIFLYDALLHVPMIWYYPKGIKEGMVIDGLTQNVDILPTLLDFAGIDVPDQLVGLSLYNVLKGNENINENRVIFASAAYSDLPENYWKHPEPYFNPDSNVPYHTRVENLTWLDEHNTFMARNKNFKLITSETRKTEFYFMNGKNIERKNDFGLTQYEDQYNYLLNKINSLKK